MQPSLAVRADLDSGLGGLRLEEIQSFVVLAEELHFARAALRLYLTTGGLSRRIDHLERALGAELVRRTTRPVTLTPYGRRFVSHAHRIVAELTALQSDDDDGELPAVPMVREWQLTRDVL
jgi:DNA-binding transcriptional LysR family regulator